MIRQQFNVDGYWNVVVFYNVDYHFFDDIKLELKIIGFPETAIEEVRNIMQSGAAKAVTCSVISQYTSVVLFNPHASKADYIDSIVHEAEHVKQAMLSAYQVEDRGESPAYTIGYLISRMYPVFRNLVF
jgi:hypothetical protein